MFAIKNHDAAVRPTFWRRLAALLCVAVVLPVTAAAGVLILFEARQTESELQTAFEAYADSMAATLDRHLDAIDDTARLVEDSEPIRRHMKQAERGGLAADAPMQEISEALGMPFSYKEVFGNRALSAVALFGGDKLQYYALPTAIDLGLQRCTALYEACRGEAFPTGRFVWSGMGDAYAYWVKDFRNIYENQYYGKLVIELYPVPSNLLQPDSVAQSLYGYALDLKRFADTQYFVYDESGLVLFSSDGSAVGSPFWQRVPERLVTGDKALAEKDTVYAHAVRPLGQYGLQMLTIVPYSSLRAGISAFGGVPPALAPCLLALYFALLFAAFWGFAAPMHQLGDYYLTTREYPLVVPSARPSCRELEQTYEVLRDRIDDITALKQECDAARLRVKEAEIRSLQAQMDPHFLFNILESIGWKAAQSGSNDVSAMVGQLGEMLRSNLLFSNKQKLTLREELQYIQNYLVLQQIQNESDFQYTINADDDILDLYYLPKLSLQPIVENCITHGFRGRKEPGRITIDVWEDMDGVFCRIADNGCGFDAQAYFANAPRAAGRGAPQGGNHIALCNIQERLHMRYGPSYGLTIDSAPELGTTVTVRLPFDMDGE